MLTKTANYEYDGAGVGDSNLTTVTEYPGAGHDDRVTKLFYDWRNCPMAVKEGVRVAGESGLTGVQRQITYVEYDNADHVTLIEKYDGDEGTISSSSGVPQCPTYPSGTTQSRLCRRAPSHTTTRGCAYKQSQFGVDQSSGAPQTNPLLTSIWYDPRGNVMKVSQPGQATEKYRYDGAGRIDRQYVVDASGDSNYDAAKDVGGDTVLEQREWAYDANSNVTFEVTKQRAPTSGTTGSIGDVPTDDDGGAAGGSSASPAWISYLAHYYDAANRLTTTYDAGNHGGYKFTRPSSAPSGDPITGTAASASSTTTVVDTSLTGADDVYVGYTLTVTSGTYAGEVRTVVDYVASSDTLTVFPGAQRQPDGEGYSISDGRTTTYSYDSAGRLEKRFDPRKDVGSGNHIVSKYFTTCSGARTRRSRTGRLTSAAAAAQPRTARPFTTTRATTT